MSFLQKLKSLITSDDSDASTVDKVINQGETPKQPKVFGGALGVAAAVAVGTITVKISGIGAPAAAESLLNTTAIVDMIGSMTDIFPSMGNMVVAIVPTLLILAIVAFLLGFFDSILDAIQGAMKFGRR